jgi:hypothetical protein
MDTRVETADEIRRRTRDFESVRTRKENRGKKLQRKGESIKNSREYRKRGGILLFSRNKSNREELKTEEVRKSRGGNNKTKVEKEKRKQNLK